MKETVHVVCLTLAAVGLLAIVGGALLLNPPVVMGGVVLFGAGICIGWAAA